MTPRCKSRCLFALGLAMGFATAAGGLTLLVYRQFGRAAWRIPISQHPARDDYRRLRIARDQFYADVGRPPDDQHDPDAARKP